MRRAPAAVVTASHLNHMHVFPTQSPHLFHSGPACKPLRQQRVHLCELDIQIKRVSESCHALLELLRVVGQHASNAFVS